MHVYHDTDAEDHSITQLEFECSGRKVLCVGEDSWVKQGGMQDCIEVYGDKGVCYSDLFQGNSSQMYSLDGYDYASEKAGATTGWTFPIFEEAFNQGYPQELTHFVDCVRSGKKPVSDGEYGKARAGGHPRRVPVFQRGPQGGTALFLQGCQAGGQLEVSTVQRFSDDKALGRYLADRIADIVRAKPDALISIAAGTSSFPLFDALKAKVRAGEISFAQATFFGMDEWCGLPQDARRRHGGLSAPAFSRRGGL